MGRAREVDDMGSAGSTGLATMDRNIFRPKSSCSGIREEICVYVEDYVDFSKRAYTPGAAVTQ
jgi:hypothetical protein